MEENEQGPPPGGPSTYADGAHVMSVALNIALGGGATVATVPESRVEELKAIALRHGWEYAVDTGGDGRATISVAPPVPPPGGPNRMEGEAAVRYPPGGMASAAAFEAGRLFAMIEDAEARNCPVLRPVRLQEAMVPVCRQLAWVMGWRLEPDPLTCGWWLPSREGMRLGEAGLGRRHELKTWPEFFKELLSGNKTFELRLNDRDFREGDVLALREWDPATEEYTGRVVTGRAGYILGGGTLGVPAGYAVISLRSL